MAEYIDICSFSRRIRLVMNALYQGNRLEEFLKPIDADDGVEYAWRAELRNSEDEIITVCIHQEQVFGKVFERREKKDCDRPIYAAARTREVL